VAYYTRPEEVHKRFIEEFNANGARLGFAYIAVQQENLITEYPALDLSSGPVLRDIQTTHQFGVLFEMSIWVYHAKIESTHARRSIEDMELATRVVNFLHTPNMRVLLDPSDPGPNQQKIIFGYVTQELPGIIGRERGGSIMTTRLVWNGQSEGNFDPPSGS